MTDVITLQIHHDRDLEGSNPYPEEVEKALDNVKAHGLVERGWDKSGQPGIIRHETGPEILVGLAALVQLAAALVELFKASRKSHPEANITIAVADPQALKAVLEAIAK